MNNVFDEIGYEPKTTFWDDFCIANMFGKYAIIDTYNRAFKNWKNNYEYMTELVLVLNHQIWALYKQDEKLARLYDELWRKLDNWYFEYYKDNKDALHYFIEITD